MCDYSLQNVKSRPAKGGEKLTTRHERPTLWAVCGVLTTQRSARGEQGRTDQSPRAMQQRLAQSSERLSCTTRIMTSE